VAECVCQKDCTPGYTSPINQDRSFNSDTLLLKGQISPKVSPESEKDEHVLERVQRLHTTPTTIVQYSKALKKK